MQINYLPTEEKLSNTTSKQLDAWAAILVMEWEYKEVRTYLSPTDTGRVFACWFSAGGTWVPDKVPSFSLDAEYAQRLMHKLATEWLEVPLLYHFEMAPLPVKSGGWDVSICDKHGRMLGASSDWLPTAICLTCIRYRLAEGSFSEAQLASLMLWNEKQAREER